VTWQEACQRSTRRAAFRQDALGWMLRFARGHGICCYNSLSQGDRQRLHMDAQMAEERMVGLDDWIPWNGVDGA
jgi:hypothetical protein